MKTIKKFLKQNLYHEKKLIFFKVFALLLLILLITSDQLSKNAAKQFLQNEPERSFIPGLISFYYILNFGSAFGQFQNKTLMLTIIAIFVAFILLISLIFIKSYFYILGIIFIISGTIGNLIDRLLTNGAVIDFIKWLWFPKYIFNLADSFVTIGITIIIITLIIKSIIIFVKERKERKMDQLENE